MKAITLEEFAKIANVSTRTLRRWLKKPETLIPQPLPLRGRVNCFGSMKLRNGYTGQKDERHEPH